MNLRPLLFFPAVALGVGLFLYQTRTAETPSVYSGEIPPVAVRVVALQPVSAQIQFSGFGRVEPVRQWEAISQVAGRVTGLADDLAVGSVVKSDTILANIDPRDYEIKLAKTQANLASARAQLDEITAQAANTQALLVLESEIEEFLKTEFSRKQNLVARGAAAQATQDQANRELLNQQRKVLDLKNALALFPVQQVSVRSTIDTRIVELEEAERNLANTTIATPFAGQVGRNDLALGEYVRAGDRLLSLNDTSASEITAAVQPSVVGNALRLIIQESTEVAALLQDNSAVFSVLNGLGFSVEVKQTIGAETYSWPATLKRFVGVADASTGTVGLVVEVNNPMRPDPATRRPPLNNGSFVEVVFLKHTNPDLLMFPRSALHVQPDGTTFVYTANASDSLAKAEVTYSAILDDMVVVKTGLAAGDRVILSGPEPAILGMNLSPVAE